METALRPDSSRLFVILARVLLGLGFLSVVFAWISELTGGEFFGLSQDHLFSDATVLSLLAIGCFLDAAWHSYSGERLPR